MNDFDILISVLSKNTQSIEQNVIDLKIVEQ